MGDGAARGVTDQGYAWVILVATFFAQAGSIGFSIGGIGVAIFSFGQAFPDAHVGSLGMIGSLRISIQFLSSLLVVPLAEKLGVRLVAASGCALAAAAIVATVAATELWHAYILYGVIAGFGICCPYATTMALLGQYFDRLKHIAFPIVALGQAVGTLSFPPIVEAVREAHGHAGMLAFMSGSMVISFVCSLLLKPNDGRSLVQSYTCSTKTSAGDGGKSAVDAAVSPDSAAVATHASPDNLPLSKKSIEAEQQKLVVNGEEDGTASPVKSAMAEDSDSAGRCSALGALLNLLRRWQVCLLIINSLLWGCCTSGTQALLPILAARHGVEGEMSALGMTTNGVGMLLASIVMTSLGKCTYDRHLLYMLSCGLYGLPPLLLPLVGVTAPTYVALFSVSGWWLATLLSLCNSVLFDMASSPAEFAKLLSLYFFANGVGCFIGPVTIGSITDSFAPHVATAALATNVTMANLAFNVTTPGFASNISTTGFTFDFTTPGFAFDFATSGVTSNLTSPGLPSNITSPVSYTVVRPAPEWPAWAVCGFFGIASTLVFIPTYVSNRRKRAAKDLHGKHRSAEAANTKLVAADEAS